MRERRTTRVAFIASSGGAVIDACIALTDQFGWPIQWAGVVTDRACGAEEVARNRAVTTVRVPGSQDVASWSGRVAGLLDQWMADIVLLLFLRRVGPAVWQSRQRAVWNLHPSLLPAFPSIGALERNHAAALAADGGIEAQWMGTTLHEVNEDLDAGPILAQSRFSIHEATTLDAARHVSFLQKLTLVLDAALRVHQGECPTPCDVENQTWVGRHRPATPDAAVLRAVESIAEPWAVPIAGGAEQAVLT